ncbi:MAG TPA: hypothetical protein VLK84_25660 [Longimicrobium sp.]|nr:hypothetical protein [Longimicrobium sp.]
MKHPRMRWALVLGFLALNAAPLHAQSTDESAADSTAPRRGMQILPAGGFRYGSPLGASVYGGVIMDRPSPDFFHGPSVFGEVGQDGMRVSVGASSVSLAGIYRAQVSVIRTWKDHGDVRADQTYVGPEIAVGWLVGITLGHYWRISDGGGKAHILSLGTFFGI